MLYRKWYRDNVEDKTKLLDRLYKAYAGITSKGGRKRRNDDLFLTKKSFKAFMYKIGFKKKDSK